MICQGLRQLAISQSTLPKADPRILVAAASGAEAPPEELQEVISEVATNIHGFYVLKSSPEHPDFDPLRLYIYYFFFFCQSNGLMELMCKYNAIRITRISPLLTIFSPLQKSSNWAFSGKRT